MRLLDALSLRTRLTLAVSLLTLFALLPLNILGRLFISDNLQEQIHATLRVEAQGLRDLVESTLAEREANVRSWSEDAILRGALLFDTFDKSDAVLVALEKRHPTFAGLVLFTEDGRAVSASEARLRKAYEGHEGEVRASAWFRAALNGTLDTTGFTKVDPFFERTVLPLAVPVLSPISGARIGVLLAAYEWSQVGQVVAPALERSRARGQRSFALEILGADGMSLFDTHERDLSRPDDVVSVESINENAVRDVGDGWRFVATVDPEDAYAPLEQASRGAIALTVLSLVVAGVGGWLLARGATGPIARLSEVVGRVVREGDLTQHVEVSSRRDEVGQLAASFSQMMEHLRESTRGLQQGTKVLGQTVAELTAAAAQQERTLTKQAAALQETQVTAQEIKQTSLMAAERSQAVLGVTARAREVGRSGEATVSASLQGFEQLREQVGRVADSISALNERTQQIGGITQTVKDLADQSNMLALNAAIEAVRSGEHGKGFGVVAREIRSLADQSITSTARVREILEDIRQSIQGSVTLAVQSQGSAETGLDQVRASGDSLRELTGIIQDNASAAQQIAAAVTQQNAGVAQIFIAVTDLSRMMEESMQGLQSAQRITASLRDVAARMETVAATYRV
ncbi:MULTISPECIES: methyl-accepting chemotaxis protein [Myxococcus]|uniref:Methyl-accepting chemotaxis protein n=1 Tax=Myxococcus llanfairpwllgwyngyllgogerychwyrndrobwllllantysiliogogogochensis TaxID=2590453 RepID=A0A540WRL5_9BACT|nr:MULTISPECIES: methyl-accepting chemotaxis protein [Myxococcus]NTX09011.1 methyl-accepting chemotaxis protein [Myxococcus sp. CA040A]TQF11661.1 methyl-accepting chemotaxis protein [Myxococcus llanfairpwllgwyngyllgogerychwyrndrobwllllantysiliogogogochensis]